MSIFITSVLANFLTEVFNSSRISTKYLFYMDILPIMNVFNEWFAANTSKKLRAVFESNARSGKYKTTFAAYGYVKGDDANFTSQIDFSNQ